MPSIISFQSSSVVSSTNSFVNIQPDLGSTPQATSPTDTLTLTSSDASITITGNSGTDTINFTLAGGASAPKDAQYVTLATNATLTQERVLTGTANQIIITDNGAGSTVVLSTPQDIGTGSSPTFTGLTLSGLTAGSVLFAGAAGLISQDNANFFYTNADDSLGLGPSASTNSHTISGSSIKHRLDVHANKAGTDLVDLAIWAGSTTAAQGPRLDFIRNKNTIASPSVVASGDELGMISGQGYDGTDYESAAVINFEVDGTPGSNDMPGRIVFLTTPDGSATPAEAMRISNDKTITMAAYGTGIAHFSSAGLISSSLIVNADVNAAAAIARTKIASGSANHVIINDGSGVLSSEATLAVSRGGTNIGSYTAGDTIYASAPTTFTQVPIGSVGTIYRSTGTAPAWASLSTAGIAPSGEAYVTIGNTANLSAERALTAGTAIQVVDGGANSTVTINNTGVTSATGTSNQVNVSASTGAVTFSTPQNIHTTATPQFAGIGLQSIVGTTTPPYSMIFDRATTNLITNPSLEVNTTGWAAQGANATISRITTDAYVGTACLRVQVTPAASGQGATTTVTVSSNTRYMASLFYKANGSNSTMRITAVGNISGTLISENPQIPMNNTWARTYIAFTTGASDTTVDIRWVTAGAATCDNLIDAVQCEAAPAQNFPSGYCDGSLGQGHSWSGTANASSSSRVSGFYVLSPIATTAQNFFAIGSDGTIKSHQVKIAPELGFRGVPQSQSYINAGLHILNHIPTRVANVGGIEAGTYIENDQNGVSLWVKSAVTSDLGMIIEGSSATTGVILAVSAPSDLTNFSGSFFKFNDKAGRDSFAWLRDSWNVGINTLGWPKQAKLLGGGQYSMASGANLAGTVSVSGATVTGSGTAFTTDFIIGDMITFTGSTQTCTIEDIDSATVLTVTASPGTLTAVTYQKVTTQYEPHHMSMTGPKGDHRVMMVADASTTLFMNHGDNLKVLTTALTDGTGTMTANTAGNTGLYVASSANAAIGNGTWIYTKASPPAQVIRTISTTQWQVQPAPAATFATQAFKYQLPEQMTKAAADTDGRMLSTHIYSQNTTVTNSTLTTETSMLTTLPYVYGGQFESTRSVRIVAYGTYSGANSTKVLQIKLKLGATTLVTTAAETIGDTATGSFRIDARIDCTSTTAQKAHLIFQGISNTANVASEHLAGYGTGTEDVTQSREIDITTTWTTVAGSISFEMVRVYLE